MGAEHPVTKEELNQGIDVAVGDKAGLEGEGVSEPNPDPEKSQKISRTGQANGGRTAYSEPQR